MVGKGLNKNKVQVQVLFPTNQLCIWSNLLSYIKLNGILNISIPSVTCISQCLASQLNFVSVYNSIVNEWSFTVLNYSVLPSLYNSIITVLIVI